ncbi:MAG: hypothetical protein HY720_26225 [Planctomycetes bacterium]|nr:hypothetical protein [Planctomycetota bacterium]
MTRRLWTAVILLAALPAAFAHGEKTKSDAELAVEGGRVKLSLLLTLHDLAGAVLADRDSSGSIDEEEGGLARESIVSYCRKRFIVEGEGSELRETGGEVEYVGEFPVAAADLERVKVVVTLSYEAAEEPESLRFRLLHSPVGHEEHECRLRVRWGDRERQMVLHSGQSVDVRPFVGGGGSQAEGGENRSGAWSGAHAMVAFGLLLGLLARERRGRREAVIVFAYASGIVAAHILPPVGPSLQVASALAAGGMVYLAVENLIAREPRWRWVAAILLGIVEGRSWGAGEVARLACSFLAGGVLVGGFSLSTMLWALRKHFAERAESFLSIPVSVFLALAGVVLAVDALLAPSP